jgi:hypothetical protein
MTLVMDDSINVASAALIAQESEGADYGPRFNARSGMHKELWFETAYSQLFLQSWG